MWVKILCPIWSFIINLLYWVFHLKDLKSAIKKKKELVLTTKNIDSIKQTMSKFSWVEDKWKDWRPWIITIINSRYKDDCDGATELAKFLFEQIGIKGSILSLRGNKSGHAIFVSKDKKYMVSNYHVIEGNWTKDQIFSYFKNKYNKIITRNLI